LRLRRGIRTCSRDDEHHPRPEIVRSCQDFAIGFEQFEIPDVAAEKQSRQAAERVSGTDGVMLEFRLRDVGWPTCRVTGSDIGRRRRGRFMIEGLYDAAKAVGAESVSAANWVTGELTAWMRRGGDDIEDVPMTGDQLAELLAILADGTVSSSAAKDVLEGVLAGEGDPREVATARDLIQISDTAALEEAVALVLDSNPDAVASFHSGEAKVVGFLVGQVMRSTQGKADPKQVNDIIRRKLSS
jgi:hypothetical protein